MVLTSSEDKVERRSVRSFTSPEVIPDDKKSSSTTVNTAGLESEKDVTAIQVVEIQSNASNSPPKTFAQSLRDFFSFDGMRRSGAVLIKLARFTGPGTLISVAYVDPDNFQTAIDAGAQFQYKLLVIVLLGVLMAIYLQVRLLISPPRRLLMLKGTGNQVRMCYRTQSCSDEQSTFAAMG